MATLTEILAQLTDADTQTFSMPEGWGQGRALFGGLTAAIAWQAAEYGVGEQHHLRAFTVSFVGPIQSGPSTIKRRVLRQGKNVTQVAVEIEQDEQVVLVALASYGVGRESKVQVKAEPMQQIPAAEHGYAFPDVPHLPEFTHHYDYAVTVGALPFMGKQARQMGGWMRERNSQDPLTIGTLLGLVDAWPPAVLMHLDQPTPASSLTWTIEFTDALEQPRSAGQWLQYVATIDIAGEGYGHIHALIHDEAGELLAISRQTVTVFG